MPTESSAAHPAEDEGQSLARQRVDPPFDFQNFVYIFFHIYALYGQRVDSQFDFENLYNFCFEIGSVRGLTVSLWKSETNSVLN